MDQGLDQGVGGEIKRLRNERDWSMARLAVEADMSVSGVSMIENGKRNLTTTTLAKLAGAFGMEVADLFPKAEAPLPFSPDEGDAQRRLAKVDEVAAKYLSSRAEKHDAEVRDPNSPHFANATAATLWLAGVEDELAAWLDWAAKDLMEIRAPAGEGFGAAVASAAHWFFEVLGPVLGLHMVTQSAKGRIEAMSDAPDALAARRLENAATAAKRSEERFRELGAAANE